MTIKRENSNIRDLTLIAIFSALVVVLQYFAGNLSAAAGVNFTLSLTPIVLSGALVGIKGGVITGTVFGVMTVANALMSRDMWTASLLNSGTKNCIFTLLICFVKAIAAGLVAALVYKVVKKKNELLAVVLASAIAPVVNTGLFILMVLLTLSDALASVFGVADIIYYLFIGCAGINFIVEFTLNLLLAPVIQRVIKATSKGKI